MERIKKSLWENKFIRSYSEANRLIVQDAFKIGVDIGEVRTTLGLVVGSHVYLCREIVTKMDKDTFLDELAEEILNIVLDLRILEVFVNCYVSQENLVDDLRKILEKKNDYERDKINVLLANQSILKRS